MGENARHREAKRKLSLIEAAVGPAAPNLVHAIASPVVGNRRTRTVCIRVSATPEDLTFLRTIAKNAGTTLGPLTARILTLLCRTIRTGEPIDWRLAYSLDIKVSKACTEAIEALRKSAHSPNDLSQALQNCAQSLDELRAIVDAARIEDRDRCKPRRRAVDTVEMADRAIREAESKRFNTPPDS